MGVKFSCNLNACWPEMSHLEWFWQESYLPGAGSPTARGRKGSQQEVGFEEGDSMDDAMLPVALVSLWNPEVPQKRRSQSGASSHRGHPWQITPPPIEYAFVLFLRFCSFSALTLAGDGEQVGRNTDAWPTATAGPRAWERPRKLRRWDWTYQYMKWGSYGSATCKKEMV